MGSLSGLPVAFDASSISDIADKPEFGNLLVIPNISDNDIKWNALQLCKEGNLLRYVLPPSTPSGEPDIDIFISAGYLIKQMQECLLYNYFHQGNPEVEEPRHWQCIFPKDKHFERHASQQ